jgi:N-acetylmuramoyl-L-alanine amidase
MSAHGSSGSDLGRPWQDPANYRAWPDTTTKEAQVFSGLAPRDHSVFESESCTQSTAGTVLKNSFFTGLPILMTGTLTAGVAATGAFPAPEAYAAPAPKASENASIGGLVQDVAERLQNALHPVTHAVVGAIAPHIPDTYTVQDGDTVETIAATFGLPPAAVLALNGLHVNSAVHEGQVLKLTTAPTKQRAQAPPRVGLSQYVIQSGDTIASVALRFGISETSLKEANELTERATLVAGDVLRIPGTRQVTAPRAIPAIQQAHAQSQSRVVWANLQSGSDGAATGQRGAQLASLATTDAGANDTDETSEDAFVDPLTVDIPDAPALRVVKPPPPPPPPPPAAAPAPPKASSSNSSSNQSSSSSSGSSSNSSNASSSPAPAPAPSPPASGNIVQLRHDWQRDHARTVIRVGRDLGVPDYGIVIALATAMQESSFRNIRTSLDHDSLGLFQQRPHWWGTPEQLTDPVYATTAFFKGAVGTNGQRSRGLLNISGWQSLPLTVAAQRVQLSAHPDAYAKWEASAWSWLAELG